MTVRQKFYLCTSEVGSKIEEMKRLHAHIYFIESDGAKAHTLANKARVTNLFETVDFYDKPVGPHASGMIELHFDDRAVDQVMKWLEIHHGNFSVLIHEDTGDDFRDHTEGIHWLGKPLSIDFGFFELIKTNPELKIHQ